LVKELRSLGLPVHGLAEQEREPLGLRALASVAKSLERPLPPAGRMRAAPAAAPATRGMGGVLEEIAPPGTRLLFFGGKGGVGKTTAAAAAAICLASRGTNTVLLLSTDPAHSLGDVLRTRLDDEERAVAPRLWARELDAGRAFEQRRARYRVAVEELFASLRGGSAFDAPFDRAVMDDLIELAPPGLDELFALLAVIAALPRHDTVVVDTAPTGHALRLLELAGKAREWVQVLLQIQLKYRRITGLGELARDLTETARELRELQELLRDTKRCRFIAVTRPATLPRLETARLLARLKRLRVAAPAVLVNALTPPGCSRCKRSAAAEAKEVRALRQSGRGWAMLGAPRIAPAPVGLGALERFGATWTRME
jgi:arsenite-transporting ATPase